MTRVEYNGGPDFFVGASTDPYPTPEKDGISEGAAVYERDTKTVKVFDGTDTWDTAFSFD